MKDVLIFSMPIALAALGESVVQRSGVLNIGLEGTMLVAAYGATAVSLATGSAVTGLLAGVALGLIITLLFALYTVKLRCDQVVTGTAINLLALGVTSALFRNKFGDSGNLLSLPKLPTLAFGLDMIPFLGIIVLASLIWVMRKSAWGLLVRASGDYPTAVTAAGFSVNTLRLQALVVGGILGGLAGAYLAVGINGSFAEGMTAGRGFVAIALVTFGRWSPGWVFAAALGMGYLESLQFEFQARGWNVPFQLLLALPYLVALIILVFVGKGASAPRALGIAYKEER